MLDRLGPCLLNIGDLMPYNVVELKDKTRILKYLETERRYAAYAIGDLEESFFGQCQWYAAQTNDSLEALALLFHGLTPPALFLMGAIDGLRALLETQVTAQQVYFMCRPEHLDVTFERYTWIKAVPMWRMTLDLDNFIPERVTAERLGLTHLSALQELYVLGGGDAFTKTQLEQGVFYGIEISGKLVSAAGTHLVSQTYGVAAVGNVFTHPAYRNRGYASKVTNAVLVDLRQLGIWDIVLNVAQENRTAISLYDRLGFRRACAFFEGPATRN
jgi:ribosomal protein S18 acetylase RimI-like enzyme